MKFNKVICSIIWMIKYEFILKNRCTVTIDFFDNLHMFKSFFDFFLSKYFY